LSIIAVQFLIIIGIQYDCNSKKANKMRNQLMNEIIFYNMHEIMMNFNPNSLDMVCMFSFVLSVSDFSESYLIAVFDVVPTLQDWTDSIAFALSLCLIPEAIGFENW